MTKDFETTIVRHIDVGQTCCDPAWEAAYERFESREEEITKFTRRLLQFELDQLSKVAPVAELFCGRGGGLVALERLGFEHLAGVDLSEELLAKYRGPATLHLADCRTLPFDSQSLTAVIVQGGLHHLPDLPGDLDAVLSEVARVLRPGGRFYVLEPWFTPFLRMVHAIVANRAVRSIYRKGDALAEMIDHERETYQQWLERPAEILALFQRHFVTRKQKIGWGKLMFVGEVIDQAPKPSSSTV